MRPLAERWADNSNSGFNIAVTRVVVANLDRGTGQSAGAILTDFLQSDDLKSLLTTTLVNDEATARDQVNNKQADVAVIIPADFSQAAFTGNGAANIVLYHDPTLTVGPLIVKQLLAQFADGFSGARITLDVAAQQLGPLDAATAQAIATQYGAVGAGAGTTAEQRAASDADHSSPAD